MKQVIFSQVECNWQTEWNLLKVQENVQRTPFTVNGCQIVKFCDTVEYFFQNIALKIKKYQSFYKFFCERYVNVPKMKILKMTKQCIQQAVFHKENVYITYVSQITLLFFVYITHINKNKYLTLPNARKVGQNKSILHKYQQKLNGISFCFS